MDRVTSAYRRFGDAKALVAASGLDRPCIECQFYELACRHPSVAEVIPHPETGTVTLKAANAAQARMNDGVCGPEGALFSPRSFPATLLIRAVKTTSGRWALALVVFLLWAVLFS